MDPDPGFALKKLIRIQATNITVRFTDLFVIVMLKLDESFKDNFFKSLLFLTDQIWFWRAKDVCLSSLVDNLPLDPDPKD